MKPGLYDKNDNLIESWDELEKLGLDIKKDYQSPFLANTKNEYPYSILNEYKGAYKLVLPENISNIGDFAFYNCENLKEISFSKNLEYIKEAAFSNCCNLEEIFIPEKVAIIDNYIENSCFYECLNLKNITLPDKIEVLNDLTFKGCKSLEEITLPKNLKTFGNFIFANCYNLKKIHFPDSLNRFTPNSLMMSNIKEIYVSKKWAEKNDFFVLMYEPLIKIEKTLDDILDEGKSFKEINNLYKDDLIK